MGGSIGPLEKGLNWESKAFHVFTREPLTHESPLSFLGSYFPNNIIWFPSPFLIF